MASHRFQLQAKVDVDGDGGACAFYAHTIGVNVTAKSPAAAAVDASLATEGKALLQQWRFTCSADPADYIICNVCITSASSEADGGAGRGIVNATTAAAACNATPTCTERPTVPRADNVSSPPSSMTTPVGGGGAEGGLGAGPVTVISVAALLLAAAIVTLIVVRRKGARARAGAGAGAGEHGVMLNDFHSGSSGGAGGGAGGKDSDV